MELLIKAAVAGMTGALIMLVLKKTNPEMSLVLALATGAFVVTLAMELFTGVRDIIDYAAETGGLSPELLTPVLKCVAIGIICRFASDVCRDAGAGSIASSVELAGAAAALFIALPLIRTLFSLIGGLI